MTSCALILSGSTSSLPRLKRTRTAAARLAAAVFASASVAEAWADEGGSGYWMPGSFAYQAAAPAPLGWSIELAYYHATQTLDPSVNVTRGSNQVSGLYTSSNLMILTPTYSFLTPGWGGQMELSVTFQAGNYTAADAGTTNADSMTGLGDISPAVTQKWTTDNHNMMIYAAGNIPAGYYDPNRLATTGLGRWSIDAGAGYTYYDDKPGLEFSAVLGFTYNFTNQSTLYQSGADLHLDLSASKALTDSVYLGAVAYVYNQLTGDSGIGAAFGPFQSSVVGVGPQLGYNFSLGGRAVQMNGRGYYEVAGLNRPQGWNAWLTFTFALNKSDK